jgi:transposase
MFPPSLGFAAQLQELSAELAALKAENAWLKRQLFGPGKSEKLDRLQTNLPLAEPAPQPVTPKTETITYERIAAPKEKRPLPAEIFKDVPVKETIVIEPDEVKAVPEAYERIGAQPRILMGVFATARMAPS